MLLLPGPQVALEERVRQPRGRLQNVKKLCCKIGLT